MNLPIVIVDSHHKVLPAWANFRRSLHAPPRLLTLDHHTDTSPPFRNFIRSALKPGEFHGESLQKEWLAALDFQNALSVEESLLRLSNDEHIVTAIRTKIISSALVIAHNAYDTDLQIYEEHRIMCRGVDRKPQSNALLRSDYDQVLESFFLEDALRGFDDLLKKSNEPPLCKAPYILDIDLDYLNTIESVRPRDPKALQKLARNAGLISIATEPEYVKSCARDASVTSETLLPALLALLTSS